MTSMHQQLAFALRDEIRRGVYKVGMTLPPVTELARRAGISLRTADLALDFLIKEGLCARRPKKGTFVIANGGQFLSRGICGVWSQFDPNNVTEHPLSFELYNGILEAASKLGTAITVMANGAEDMVTRYQRSPEFDFRGVLTLDSENYEATLSLARSFPEYRFAFLNYMLGTFDMMPQNMFAVVNDDYCGGRTLAHHHLKCGRKRFALLSRELPPHDMVYHERMRGFEDEIAANGGVLCAREIMPMTTTTDEMAQWEECFLVRLGNMTERVEVLLCTSDIIAILACKYQNEHSELSDVQISGYDNFLPDFHTSPEHVCIRVPFRKIGRKALECLMQGEVHGQVVKLPPEIVVSNRCV
ncbi:MAG: GntR family transcriptional regulator [Victivallales bacterium]|nr:GntR family transcriptional regulator [Victivallales bacterium]